MSDRVDSILESELESLRQRISDNIEASGERASGKTQESLRVEVSNGRGVLLGRQAFGTTETGRKPGNVPSFFRDIILAWMEAKGISGEPIPYKTDRPHKYTPQQRGNLAAAGAIAHSIQRKGTSLFRDGGRRDIYSNEIPETLQRIKARVGEIFLQEVKSIMRQ